MNLIKTEKEPATAATATSSKENVPMENDSTKIADCQVSNILDELCQITRRTYEMYYAEQLFGAEFPNLTFISVCSYGEKTVHLGIYDTNDFYKLAEKLDVAVHTARHDDTQNKLYFHYDGVEFFGLIKREESK